MSSVTFFVLVVVIISIMWNSSFLAFYFLWHHQENDNYLLVINSYLFLREFLILLVEKQLKLRSIKLITFFYILLDIRTLYLVIFHIDLIRSYRAYSLVYANNLNHFWHLSMIGFCLALYTVPTSFCICFVQTVTHANNIFRPVQSIVLPYCDDFKIYPCWCNCTGFKGLGLVVTLFVLSHAHGLS